MNIHISRLKGPLVMGGVLIALACGSSQPSTTAKAVTPSSARSDGPCATCTSHPTSPLDSYRMVVAPSQAALDKAMSAALAAAPTCSAQPDDCAAKMQAIGQADTAWRLVIDQYRARGTVPFRLVLPTEKMVGAVSDAGQAGQAVVYDLAGVQRGQHTLQQDLANLAMAIAAVRELEAQIAAA